MTDRAIGRQLSRRAFLSLGGSAAGMALLSACSPAAQPSPTAAPKPPEPAKPVAASATQAPAPPSAAPTVAPTQAPAALTKASGPKKGGTFTMARSSPIITFNPLNQQAGHYAYVRAIYETLVRYDRNLKPQPMLAEKWEFSADQKEMTLKLRQGVKYHSGRELTSADVKTTWEFASTDDSAILRSLFQTIKGVNTPDKYTIVLKFAGVNTSIFDALDVMHIIDKDSIKDFAKNAVGTGPFVLDKYVPSDRVEMVPFKDYWDKGKPYVDRYIVRDIPDPAALAVNLESGAVDCIWQPNAIDLVRFRDSGGKYVVDLGAPGAAVYQIMMNCKQPPFDNKKVRQAISWSIDRARFCRTILQGLAEPTCLIWPKNSWAYFPDLEGKIGFDLNKAAALLKEAGLEKGFDTELITAPKTVFGSRELTQILQADLKKIGVNVKITEVEQAQYATQVQQKREYQMATQNYGRSNRDPGSVFTGARSFVNDKGGGFARIDSAEYDRLVAELNSTLDQEKRKATARKLQELMLDECFVNPVAPQNRAWANAGYVKGFDYDMDNQPFIGEVWLDK